MNIVAEESTVIQYLSEKCNNDAGCGGYSEENTIVYGDLNEKCILILEIMSFKDVGDRKLPKDVLIQVIDSKDPTKIIRQGRKEGLHDAFSLGLVWLDMALKAEA